MAIADLKGYWKFLSILYLKKVGLPVLNGIILTKLSDEGFEALLTYCEKNKWNSILLRHDKNPEKPPYPMGGYLVPLADIKTELPKYFKAGRIVFLMEPVSPFDNSYNVNSLFENDGSLLLEIVGPGFDASDLQRGQMSPHERIEIQKEFVNITSTPSSLKEDFVKRTFIIDQNAYQRTVKQRYLKIAKRLQELGKISLGAHEIDDDERIILAKSYLNDNGHQMLILNEKIYKPIPIDNLYQVYSYIQNLQEKLKGFPSFGLSFVVSASFVQQGKNLVFWDVVWPKLKYSL